MKRTVLLVTYWFAMGCTPQDVTLIPLRPDAATDSSTETCALTNKPQRGMFAYGEALQKSLHFLSAQRLGRLPPNNRVAWRGDSVLRDGEDVGRDLSGGWQESSNATKNTAATAYTVAMLAWGMLEGKGAFDDSCQTSAALAELRWGTEDLLRVFAQDGPTTYELFAGVGREADESALWVPPEVRDQLSSRPSYKVDNDVPGADIAGHISAAFAAASLVFRRVGDTSFADALLVKAERSFAFGSAFREVIGNPDKDGTTVKDAQGQIGHDVAYRSSGADKLYWAAAWLHKANEARPGYDSRYLTTAGSLLEELGNDGATPLVHWKDQSIFLANKGASLLLAQATNDIRFVRIVQDFLDWWTIGFVDRVMYTNGGLPWRQPSKPIASALNAAFVAAVYANWVTADVCAATNSKSSTHSGGKCAEVYKAFSVKVADYLLGANPQKRSYMVGFGNNTVLRPQHASAMGSYAGLAHFMDPSYFLSRWRHTLYGAVVGGPDALDEWTEAGVGQMPLAIAAEPALEISAALPGLMAMLYNTWGGTALPHFPAAEPRAAGDDEVFAEASLSGDGTHIGIWINNRSAWPATVRDRMSARYFIALEPGTSVEDVKVSLIGSECPQAKSPRVVPWRDRFAYIEADCAGTPIFPGGFDATNTAHFRKHIELRLSAPLWDATNDPSFDVRLSGGGPPQKTDRILVLDQQRPLFGRAP